MGEQKGGAEGSARYFMISFSFFYPIRGTTTGNSSSFFFRAISSSRDWFICIPSVIKRRFLPHFYYFFTTTPAEEFFLSYLVMLMMIILWWVDITFCLLGARAFVCDFGLMMRAQFWRRSKWIDGRWYFSFLFWLSGRWPKRRENEAVTPSSERATGLVMRIIQ
jgi:hypothetical protein